MTLITSQTPQGTDAGRTAPKGGLLSVRPSPDGPSGLVRTSCPGHETLRSTAARLNDRYREVEQLRAQLSGLRDELTSAATTEQAARGLDALLVKLITFIRRFVVVTDAQAIAIVLWAAHTDAIQA